MSESKMYDKNKGLSREYWRDCSLQYARTLDLRNLEIAQLKRRVRELEFSR